MLYQRPLLDLTPSRDRVVRERLGGVPFGLPAHRWPRCSKCGGSQSLLAQLEHHPDRLDLGRVGRTLMVFQCNHQPGLCETWDAFAGANACLVVEPEELGDRETALPADAPVVEHHAPIRDWMAADDGIPGAIAPSFFSDEQHLRLDPALIDRVIGSTKLGSVPFWIQNCDEAPRPGWRFVGQLDSSYSFLDAPSVEPSWITRDAERFEGRTHIGQGPNFGDGGIAYLFARDGVQRPEIVMFWQCG